MQTRATSSIPPSRPALTLLWWFAMKHALPQTALPCCQDIGWHIGWPDFWDLLSFTSFPGSPPWVQLPPFDPQLNLFCTQNAQHFGRTWTRTHQTMEKCEQGVCSAPSTANFLLSFWLMSGSWHRLLRRSARRPCFRRITCPEWWRPQLP